MISIRDINIPVYLDKRTKVKIDLKQTDTTILHLTVIRNNIKEDLTNNTFILNFVKPDNTIVIQTDGFDTTRLSEGIVSVRLREDCVRVAGEGKIELQILSDSNLVSSFILKCDIESSLLDNAVPSENVVTIQEELIQKIQEATQVKAETEQLITNGGAATTGQVAEINSQLAESTQQINVLKPKVDSLASGSPKGVYASLSALTTALPTGNTNVYITTDNGNWNYWNGSAWVSGGVYQSSGIADSSVTHNKTDFIKTGKNKCNIANAISGYWVNGNTGVLTADVLYAYIDVPVLSSTAYYMSGFNTIRYVELNSSDTRVAGGNLYTSESAITTSATTTKLRISYAIANVIQPQVELGTSKTTYESYHYEIDLLQYKGNIADNIIDMNNLKFVTKELNLFDISSPNIIYDKNFASNGSIQAQTGWLISDYMEVNDVDSFIISAFLMSGSSLWGYYQTYDINKNLVTTRANFAINTPITFATNTRYIRITYLQGAGNGTVMVGKTTVYQPFIKFGYKFPYLNIKKENIPSNYYNWYGKTFTGYGDSNTGNKMWQAYVIEKFGLNYKHLGIGGTTAVGRCTDEYLSAIPLNTSVITIMFGTNDWSQNIPIGVDLPSNIADNYIFDTTTFIGAMGKIISYIYKNIPTARIIIMSPPFRTSTTWDSVNATETTPNTIGATIIDYGTACEKLARKFGCEYIDTYHDMGINVFNFKQFLLNETYPVHLNSLGGQRLAQLVINKMLKIEPLS